VALVPVFAVVCALLVLAGAFKLRDPRAAKQSLARSGLDLPAPAIRGLGAAEIVVGAVAVIRPTVLTAALVAVAYGVFCVFMARLLRADGSAGCGCFGGGSESIGVTHVILNAIACAVAALAAVAPPAGLGWIVTRAPLVSVSLILGIGAATFAIYSVFTLFQGAWRSFGAA